MPRIDELHLPFIRTPRDLLPKQGIESARRYVATLTRPLGVDAIYLKPKFSKQYPRHPVLPYPPPMWAT